VQITDCNASSTGCKQRALHERKEDAAFFRQAQEQVEEAGRPHACPASRGMASMLFQRVLQWAVRGKQKCEQVRDPLAGQR